MPDDALVVSPAVRSELMRAVQRCEHRERFYDSLGAATRARACDGVRLLLHAGVVVLTSNSRQRFDPAFVRRLDFIIDFGSC
ncbi:hypothetical protein QTH97_32175 [Variovorax sp. J22R24]|uniref:hypothetical protein n=1 Tax=Variovorax gracilis TaxID=3053502 RepID=UPI0025750871|nr:hypothetical protein [Variovorax sp. J22R24]MDM0109617.1 hypothetical protein [Variovorax sp. J22R24]